MGSILQNIFDILFPPSEEQQVVRDCNKVDIANLFVSQQNGKISVLAPFADKRISACVHEAKYHNNDQARQLLGTLLSHHLRTRAVGKAVMLVPIPLARARKRKRGYNQVAEIMRAAHLKPEERILKRVKNTTPQTELPRKKRLVNVQGAFACTNPEKVRGRDIVLIDDVATTGATLTEARSVLIKAGAKRVRCIALAG